MFPGVTGAPFLLFSIMFSLLPLPLPPPPPPISFHSLDLCLDSNPSPPRLLLPLFVLPFIANLLLTFFLPFFPVPSPLTLFFFQHQLRPATLSHSILTCPLKLFTSVLTHADGRTDTLSSCLLLSRVANWCLPSVYVAKGCCWDSRGRGFNSHHSFRPSPLGAGNIPIPLLLPLHGWLVFF